MRDVAIATHGQVIEALVANRLTSPQPLCHVEDWAREWAVAEVFGVGPDALNDDRVGRALDAVAPVLAGVAGSVGVNAIARFGIDTSRIHWDMTSISLFGDYDGAEAGFAEPSYGHPKDRRVDLKQIQTGLGVTDERGHPRLPPRLRRPRRGGQPGGRGHGVAAEDVRAPPVLAGGRHQAGLLRQRR